TDGGVGDARSSDAGSSDAGVGDATWTRIYNTMFVNMSYASNCTGSPCHDPGTQKGIDFSTQMKGYTTIKSHLVAGSPSKSQLYTKLSSGTMPQARPKMSAADLAVVSAWITQGALNN
ncbi:MAG TPA: cytochrome c, partial [Polyangia bacterium]|nr:cytochrome c [Polyangia bacterium]